RELLDNVQYSPARGRFKIYLIDEVHILSKSSSNALLKTLEEPPPRVKFLLATTDPQKLPATVLSRCLQFNLKRLTTGLMRDRLEHICAAEQIPTDAASLSMLARAADGSLRDALSLLDQAVAYCGGELEQDAVASMLGTIDTAHVSALLGFLADGDAPALIRAIASIDEQVPDYARLLDDLARLLQRIAVYQVVGATDSDDELADTEIAGFAERIAASDLQLFYQIALIGRRDLDLAPDPKSGVEMTLLRMLAFQPHRGADESRPDSPARNSRSRPADAPGQLKAVETPKTAAPQDDPQMLEDWGRVISELPLSGANKLLAANCAYLHRKGDTVYLGLDRRSESLLTRSRQQAIADALTDKFGKRLRVEISLATSAGDTVAAETPMQAEARRSDEKLEAARESLESDPNVKALRDMFGAELNPDSIELIDDTSVSNPVDRKRVDNPRSAPGSST
ncbi:MAG TPA: DNA polymerase III subunit gamma/tau C-terminal domain-containing protein, partial [Woeseiaceae bacterium]|nr:DNA polymerase III subunit gamma/tau C-terminal domain-containing protein [Woeseiaceae bacterium]